MSTTAEPLRYRVPAHLRGGVLVPAEFLFREFLWTGARETDVTDIQGSYSTRTIILVTDLDTTFPQLDENTEGTIETPGNFDNESLRELAKKKPRQLIRWVQRGGLEPPDLTFAAEAVGAITDSNVAVPVLLKLVHDDSPLVREGAVYGLEKHASSSTDARAALRRLAAEDPSPGVKLAAKEALDDL